VQLEGSRPQVDLLDAYAKACVFALAPAVQANGDRDGIPNVIQEALAAGVPVVATSVSGIPEVVRDGVNGRLVPPGQPEALADALEALLRQEEVRTRLGDTARELAAAELDLSVCVRGLAVEHRAALAAATGCARR
jgi:glycosyltransferase involved in cell wall biosynthesis